MSKLVAFAKNCGILKTRMDQKGDHIKMNFDYFQIQKLILQTGTKSRWKKEVICPVFKFLSWVMALNLSRKMNFLQFCADFSKKPKSVKAIYIFHLKVLTTLFQKMIWFIGVWTTLYTTLAIEISKNMLTQLKFDKII